MCGEVAVEPESPKHTGPHGHPSASSPGVAESQLLPPQVPGAAYTVFPVHSVYLCPGVKFIAAILKILLLEIKYLSL